MIIVEGMDNSGKTTLIKKLAEVFGERVQVIKPPGPFRSSGELNGWLDRDIELIQKGKEKFTIYDRYPILSEPIYGPEIRKHSMITGAQVEKALDKLQMADTPTLVIYCRPHNDSIHNFGEREQMEGVIDNAHAMIKSYDHMMGALAARCNSSLNNLTVLPYDWGQIGAEEFVIKYVEDMLDTYERYS